MAPHAQVQGQQVRQKCSQRYKFKYVRWRTTDKGGNNPVLDPDIVPVLETIKEPTPSEAIALAVAPAPTLTDEPAHPHPPTPPPPYPSPTTTTTYTSSTSRHWLLRLLCHTIVKMAAQTKVPII